MNFDNITFADLVLAAPEIKNTLNIIKTNIDLSFDSPKFIYDKRICSSGTYSSGDINHVEYACNRACELVLPENSDYNRYALFWDLPNGFSSVIDFINTYNVMQAPFVLPLKLLWKNDGVIRQSHITTTDYYFYFHTGWLDNFPTRTPLEQHNWDDSVSNSFMAGSAFDEETLLSVATTIPMYNNYAEAVDYINSGDVGAPINSDSNVEEESPEQVNYFYNMELYRTRNSYDNATLYKTVKLDFNMTPKSKVSGYITSDAPYNVKINQTHTGDYVDGSLTIDDVQQAYGSYNNLIANASNTLTYTEEDGTIKADGYFYFANVQTNIPIFGSEHDSNRYQRNEIDRDAAKIGIDDKPNRTGDKLTNTENTQADITSKFSNVYVVEESSLMAVADAVFSTVDNIFEAMEKGLRMLGDNMIDVICGLYVTPIDINAFLTDRSLQDIYIGGYKTDGVGVVGKNNKTIVLCNTYIAPTYNNFLDYSNVFLSLYLPGCGIVPLDAATFIGNYLKIEVACDVRTHTFKYYIKVSNGRIESIVEIHEGSIGADMPITGADQIGKIKQLQGVFASAVGAGSSLVPDVPAAHGTKTTGAKMAATQFAQNQGMLVDAGMEVYNAYAAINSAPSIKQSGNTSSGTSCFDPMYPYLIFDKQEAVIPAKLYSEYGVPTNTITMLSNCSGWTEAHDIKLDGDMLSIEKDIIKSMFAGGVVL